MTKLYSALALGYFVAATVVLMSVAAVLLVSAAWQLAVSFGTVNQVEAALDSAGLLIIGFAIVETAKFFAEEEILRRRELRSPIESRRSLTKFITIIVIAACLEALVMVFKTGRTNISESIYPAVLFGSSMLALVALGLYQWLSSRIATPPPAEQREAERSAAERS
jgi:uncharacterized membrane protein